MPPDPRVTKCRRRGTVQSIQNRKRSKEAKKTIHDNVRVGKMACTARNHKLLVNLTDSTVDLAS